MDNTLFNEEFLQKLEYLWVVARKIMSGRSHAFHRTRRYGSSVEFADYRSYSQGDDLRYIDWNAYVRLDDLFLKLFEEEEDLHVYLLIDVSASMRMGSPVKLDYARHVAAAIGYIGLASLDRVNITPFADRLGPPLETTRGKNQIFTLLRFLSRISPLTHTHLAQSVSDFVLQRRQRGVAVVLSDFLDTRGYAEALSRLCYCRFEPYVIHVIDPEDRRPSFTGDLRLRDSETGSTRVVTATERVKKRYQRRFEAFREQLRQYCLQKEIGYSAADTTIPFDQFVLSLLRAGRLLR